MSSKTHLQNIQHSKLHRLGIFFSEPLDVLGISHFTEFVRDIGVSILRLVTQLGVRNMKAFDEQIQQLCKLEKNIWCYLLTTPVTRTCRRRKGSIGCEEGLHEHGSRVDMIRQTLHKLDQGRAFYQRHSAVLFPFLKHDITWRVKLRKAIRTGIWKPNNNNNC